MDGQVEVLENQEEVVEVVAEVPSTEATEPVTVDKAIVTQIELALFSVNAEELASLKKKTKALEKLVEKDEKKILARLKAGAEVEPGHLLPKVKVNSWKIVSWKDIVTRLKGERFVKRVLARKKPTESPKLEVVKNPSMVEAM